MGLGTVVTSYILGRSMFSRYKGVLAAILAVFWPLFVLYSHRGELTTSHLFLMNLVVLFFWLARRQSIFWLVLGLTQGLFFWVDARAALASLFIIFSFYLVDFVWGGSLLSGFSTSEVESVDTSEVSLGDRGKCWGWGLLLFLAGFVPMAVVWPSIISRAFPNNIFLNPYMESMRFLPLEMSWWEIVFVALALIVFLWSLGLFGRLRGLGGFRLLKLLVGEETSLLSFWLILSCFAASLTGNKLLILVPLCLLISHFATEMLLRTQFLRYSSLIVVGIASVLLTSLLWYKILPPSPYDGILVMLDFRYGYDEDGNNPNLLVGEYTPIVEYYSDTPVKWFDSYDDLYKNLIIKPSEEAKKARRRAYYLVDGYWFKQVVSGARGQDVSLRVLRAQGTMLLVEKF